MDSVNRIDERKHHAKLAEDFNDFYLKLSSSKITQIGNYQIVGEIGEGSFGKVYLAIHVLLNIKVVLKCGSIDDQNIIREIYYHKQLKHKNVVSLYEVIKTETNLWLALEYCEGGELYYYIYENKVIDYKKCQQLFYQIVRGVQFVHSRGLSHRDLKLENILLADKKKSVIKLTDFGFVREYKKLFLSTICGTTCYMAPELLKGNKYSGPAIDIWSMGIILFTMLYGEMPFDDDDELRTKFNILNNEPRYKSSIPEETVALLKRMLSKDAHLRPNINDLLNSNFLIDIHKKHTATSKRYDDAESIISISQHYRANKQPLQTKTDRILMKKLRKLNLDMKRLKRDYASNDMNPLTALYELSLKKEYCRKKKKHYEEKQKYFETRRSLKRSKDKIRNALISDGPQQLERILTGLSLSSNNTGKVLSNSKKEGENDEGEFDPKSYPASIGPHTRTVSFGDGSQSLNQGSQSVTSSNGESQKRRQPKQIFNKLQFWKKKDKTETQQPEIFDPNDSNDEDTKVDYGMPLKVDEDPHGRPPPANRDSDTSSKSPDMTMRLSRPRPSSMISQISQMSQLSQTSQLSTLMTESEVDNLDEIDTVDEYDYDDIHERSSSLSNEKSQPGSLGPSSRKIQYKRTSSSDQLLVKHSKRSSLSRLSSNSSESSAQSIGPMNESELNVAPQNKGRPSSPELPQYRRSSGLLPMFEKHPTRSYSPPVPKKHARLGASPKPFEPKPSWRFPKGLFSDDALGNRGTFEPVDEEVEGEF